MIARATFKLAIPLACSWAERQELRIVRDGVALNVAQMVDARRIGIIRPERVRLRVVDQIPFPLHPLLRQIGEKAGLISSSTIGLTLRYGIYIRADYWGERRLVVHELTHTAQYERLGGFRPFLESYFLECMTGLGYPIGPLEQEAKSMEEELCA